MRTSAPPASPRSKARNANIVAIALTAALVTLQLIGLAMLERSHALPVSPSQVNSPDALLCTGGADVPATPSPYD
ncbi:hypothetical protein [Bradyrhizobium sp. YR681]|uniref:hypothetical protein n=1 Tax=Bradyrhizobium sp. YR681 TaxID=1144344 RepID=UPI0002E9DC22|nr:hypothetical protein [Bradyrhizobium sp. YR681]